MAEGRLNRRFTPTFSRGMTTGLGPAMARLTRSWCGFATCPYLKGRGTMPVGLPLAIGKRVWKASRNATAVLARGGGTGLDAMGASLKPCMRGFANDCCVLCTRC